MPMKQRMILTGVAIAIIALGAPILGVGLSQETDEPPSIGEGVATVEAGALLPLSSPDEPFKTVQRLKMLVTAYSSTESQTDDTPFITASGTYVREGIVATNVLPMGTKIRIPQLYGDRIFVVEDRMHPRKDQEVDIWFSTRWEATKFGVKKAQIQILES